MIVLALCFYGGFAYIPIDTQPENAPELARKQGASLGDLALARNSRENYRPKVRLYRSPG